MKAYFFTLLIVSAHFLSFAQKEKSYVKHKVQQGETLFSLSRKYQVKIKDIKKESPGMSIKLGETLLIPGKVQQQSQKKEVKVGVAEKTTNEIQHVVMKGETLYSISKKYDVEVEDIKNWNGTDTNLSLGQTILIKKGATKHAPIIHEVQKGETLYAIGKKYQADLKDVRDWNKLTSSDLSEGQRLIVGYEGMEPKVKFNINDFDGIAYMDSTGLNTDFHYALHASIPKGRVIRVANKSGSREFFIRVVGGTKSGVQRELKLSKLAFKNLGGIEGEPLEVNVTYLN